MTDLVEFLGARLDEDKQAALAAAQRSDRAWQYTVIPGEPDGYSLDLSDERVLIVDWTDEDELMPPEAEHIARHDPARVLREVEAKRQVVDAYAEALRIQDGFHETTGETMQREALEMACRAYAAADADHPDYVEAVSALGEAE